MTFRPIKRLATHDEATQTARALAARIAPTDSERDRERRLPAEEIADLAATGLLAITVPKAYGGPDLSAVTLAETTAILAEADASIGQIPQNHFYLLEALSWEGSEAQKHFYFSRALAGEKFFSALSESATPHAHVGFTRLVREGEGFRIQGRKAYSTGVLLADWIGVAAKDDEDRTHLCFIDASRPGVTRIDDWASFGQRTTASGTTILENVAVSQDEVIPHFRSFERPTTLGSVGQIVHAAVDLGIARAALRDTIAFVRSRARPWPDSRVDKAVDDPLTIGKIGDVYVRIEAASALLERSGIAIDSAREWATAEAIAEASVAVAEAKVATTEAALQAASTLFELGGARSTLIEYNLDRHWRNAQTHTLHDPVRWNYHIVGDFVLNATPPPFHGAI